MVHSASDKAVNVSTSTLATNTTLPMETQSAINMALINNDAPHRIEAVIKDELNRAGYIDKMKNRALHLFRTGQAKTFRQARDIIAAEIKAAESKSNTNGIHNGTNGSLTSASALSNISGDEAMGAVPKNAVDAGRAATRKELESVLDIEVDDE